MRITGELSNDDFNRLFKKFRGKEELSMEESDEIIAWMINKKVEMIPVNIMWKKPEAEA